MASSYPPSLPPPPTNSSQDIVDQIVSSPLNLPIHVVALVSGGVSIIASVCTVVIMYKNAEGKGFYQRKQGERLVAYLAVSDLLFGTEHMFSHVLNMIYTGRPPNLTCVSSAFLLQVFVWTQAIVVIVCALSAFLLVAKGVRIKFGKYDYRLWLVTLIVPIIVAIVFAVLRYLGPSGYWCHADIVNPRAKIIYVVNGGMMITVSIICAILYTGVWVQISRVNKLLRDSRGHDDPKRQLVGRHRTAKILVCFVVAYFAQWWALIMYGIWSFIKPPPPGPPESIFILIVLFCNLGGVFNFFAYTFIRRIQGRGLRSSPSSTASLQSKYRPSTPLARNSTLFDNNHFVYPANRVKRETCLDKVL